MPSSLIEGIKIETIPPVYFPREDSIMLAKAVKKFARGTVLDMGTGSGLQAITAVLNSNVTSVLASDVSQTALRYAEKNAKNNQCADIASCKSLSGCKGSLLSSKPAINQKTLPVCYKIKFIKSNLFENIPRNDIFETIIFNPPYLPVEEGGAEENEPFDEQSAAWHGGKDGRKILEPFLAEFSNYFKQKGTLLLVQSSLNEPEKTMKKLQELRFAVEIVEKQKFFFEELYVYKADKLK